MLKARIMISTDQTLINKRNNSTRSFLNSRFQAKINLQFNWNNTRYNYYLMKV
jgi:hypothetical protein